jgi:O-antigen ligase
MLASFSPFILRGSLQVYTPAIAALSIAFLYQLSQHWLVVARPLLIVAPYVLWVLVSFIVSTATTDLSTLTAAYSLGSVVVIVACILLAQWLVLSISLRRMLYPVAIFGTLIACLPLLLSLYYAVTGGTLVTGLTVQHLSPLRGVGSLYRLQNYGAILLVTTMATVVCAEASSRRWFGALTLQLLAIQLVGSRSTIAGFVAFIIVYAALRREWLESVRTLTHAGIVSSLSVFAALATLDQPVVSILTSQRLNTFLSGRGYIWLAARNTALDHLWFGTGLRNLGPAMASQYLAINAPNYVHNPDPHNTILRAFAATGLPGILFLLAFIYTFYLYGVRSDLRIFPRRFYFAAVTGFLGYGMFESLLFGGMSARSFVFTLFLIAGFWSFTEPVSSQHSDQ